MTINPIYSTKIDAARRNMNVLKILNCIRMNV
nr:MAG TPA: hypothetical protein [Caudoviricetes sp.]